MNFAKYDKYLAACTALLARLGAYDAALLGCRYVSPFNDTANAEINTISNQKLRHSSCDSNQLLRTSSRKPITSTSIRGSIRGHPIQPQTNSSLTINLIIHLFPVIHFLPFFPLQNPTRHQKKPNNSPCLHTPPSSLFLPSPPSLSPVPNAAPSAPS
jgi:hypothetical protein